ncbi:MAG: hypothetical protein ACUVWX_09270, partial [Kiritimatiellia bacterium]
MNEDKVSSRTKQDDRKGEAGGPCRAPAPSFVALPKLRRPPPTIFDFLVRRFPHVGRDVWLARLERGDITDDRGEVIKPDAPYRPYIRLRYFRET